MGRLCQEFRIVGRPDAAGFVIGRQIAFRLVSLLVRLGRPGRRRRTLSLRLISNESRVIAFGPKWGRRSALWVETASAAPSMTFDALCRETLSSCCTTQLCR